MPNIRPKSNVIIVASCFPKLISRITCCNVAIAINDCDYIFRMIGSVIKAANFAAIKHKDQKRLDLDKTPYINHPIGVANILTEEGDQ